MIKKIEKIKDIFEIFFWNLKNNKSEIRKENWHIKNKKWVMNNKKKMKNLSRL